MLQRLGLENFKGLKKTTIDFGRITVLIGHNGMGKSSISQALMLLRQSIGHKELRVSGELLNLGTFEDILNDEAPLGEIGILLTSKIVGEYPVLDVPKGSSFLYHVYFTPKISSWDLTIGTAQRQYLSVQVLQGETVSVQPDKVAVPQDSPEPVEVKFMPQNTVATPISIGTATPRGQKSVEWAARQEANGLFSIIKRLLGSTYYVPAIRGFDKPQYELLNDSTIDIAPGATAQLASTFVYAGDDVQETVSTWSEEITGSRLSPQVIPGRQVVPTSYAIPKGIPIIGDGFGANQLVRLLLTLASTPSGSIIAIEEPEIHLHPRAQERLCDILVQVAKNQDKQILVTTHSERVLERFAYAVRTGVLTVDELAMYHFVEKGEEPVRIEQDKSGDTYWARNLFA